MSTKTPPISQLPSDCGNYVDGEIAEVTNPRPSSTEQKIMIAGSFDSDKIQMIRELIEEEALEYFKWVYGTYNETYDGMPISSNTNLGGMTIYIDGKEYPISHSYKLYQQSK